MSVILGTIDHGSKRSAHPPRTLDRMAAVHGPGLGAALKSHTEGHCALGWLPERLPLAETCAAIVTMQHLTILLEGDLANWASLDDALASQNAHAGMDEKARSLGRAYLRQGKSVFAECDGSFRIVIWDNRLKQLTVLNDRYGLRPIYFCSESNKLYFASEVKALLAALRHSPAIDEQAIADFLSFGQLIDERGFFENVQSLPAAHMLVFSEDKLNVSGYAPTSMHSDYCITDPTEARTKLGSPVMKNISRLSESRDLGVHLTGGVDSRLLAAAHHRLGGSVRTYSSGEPGSSGAVLAEAVAKVLEAEHEFEPLTPARFLDDFSRTVWLSDGHLCGSDAPGMQLLPALRAHPRPMLVAAQPLDIKFRRLETMFWRRNAWGGERKRWLVSRLFPRIFDQHLDGDLPTVMLGRSAAGRVVPSAYRLATLIEDVDFAEMHPAKILLQMTAQLRWPFRVAHSLQVLRHYVPVFTPYYSYSYVEAVRALAPRWLSADKAIIRRLIGDLRPELANVPWQRTMLPLDASPALEYRSMAMAKLGRNARLPLLRDAKTAYFDFNRHWRNDPGFRHLLTSLMLDSLPGDIIDRKRVERFLRMSLAHRMDCQHMLTRLLTVGLWHAFFVRSQMPGLNSKNYGAMRIAA